MPSREHVIYFHGVPGGPTELEAIGGGTAWLDGGVYAPNRQSTNKAVGLSDHFDILASVIKARFERSSVRFVGFSLGAYVALEVATRMDSEVAHISLVSAAAPLSAGDFLSDMAGQMVFRSARSSRFLFEAMTLAQSLALKVAPDSLFNAMFASAQGMDRELATHPRFRTKIIEAMKECLLNGTSNYQREINGYLQDWSAILPCIRQPVELWHGSLDNWAPPLMAEALARALPNVTGFHMLENRSHYSALQAYFEQHFS